MNPTVKIATNIVDGPPASRNGDEPDPRHPSIARQPREIERRPGAEFYDTLLWRLSAKWNESPTGYSLGLTSCSRGADVSALAANLAIRAADHGIGPVLLVDANAHSAHLHRLLTCPSTPNLAGAVAEPIPFAQSICRTTVAGLDLLPLGADGSRNQWCGDSAPIEALLCDFRENYALVLVDLPSAHDLGQSLPLARILDAAVLVIRAGRVRRHAAQQALEQLANDGVYVLGAVLTNHHQYVPQWLGRMI